MLFTLLGVIALILRERKKVNNTHSGQEENADQSDVPPVRSCDDVSPLGREVNNTGTVCATSNSAVEFSPASFSAVSSCTDDVPQTTVCEVSSCNDDVLQTTVCEESGCTDDVLQTTVCDTSGCTDDVPQTTVCELSGCTEDVPQTTVCEVSGCTDDVPQTTVCEVSSCTDDVPQTTVCEVSSCTDDVPQTTVCELSGCTDDVPQTTVCDASCCTEDVPQTTVCEVSGCTDDVPQTTVCDASGCTEDVPQTTVCEVSGCTDDVPQTTVCEVSGCTDDVPQTTVCEASGCTEDVPQTTVCDASVCTDDVLQTTVCAASSCTEDVPQTTVCVTSICTDDVPQTTVCDASGCTEDVPQTTVCAASSCSNEDPIWMSQRISCTDDNNCARLSDDISFFTATPKLSDDVLFFIGTSKLSDVSFFIGTSKLSDVVSFFNATPKICDDVSFFTATPKLSDDVSFFTATPKLSDDVSFFTATPKLSDDVSFFTATPKLSDDISLFIGTSKLSDEISFFTATPKLSDVSFFTATSILSDDVSFFSAMSILCGDVPPSFFPVTSKLSGDVSLAFFSAKSRLSVDVPPASLPAMSKCIDDVPPALFSVTSKSSDDAAPVLFYVTSDCRDDALQASVHFVNDLSVGVPQSPVHETLDCRVNVPQAMTCEVPDCSVDVPQALACAAPDCSVHAPQTQSSQLQDNETTIIDINSRHYEIGSQLGEGSFGSVYAATRLDDGLQVAIKFASRRNTKFISIDGYSKRLPLEVALQILANKGPRVEEIIQILDWQVDPDYYFMVLERPMPCQSLYEYLKCYKGTMEEDLARVIMHQAIFAARMCCLRGVLHRDIKLENLLINPNTLEVKLIDFGCGAILTDEGYTSFAGTREYCPPEYRMTGRYHAEPATVWSLGVLLFMILFRKFPKRRHLRKINDKNWTKAGLSKECCDFIRRCLQIDPKQRIELGKLSLHAWLMTADKLNNNNTIMDINSCRYVISCQLGEGDCGTVYAATRVDDGQKVAIKVVSNRNKKFISIDGYSKPLPLEVALQILANEGPRIEEIIQLLDWRLESDRYILVLERPVPFEELNWFLLQQMVTIHEDVARVIMRQATFAAQTCCRRGVFHRDIKLENLLINPDTLEVKLTDFGCGEFLNSVGYTSFVGTTEYCPPEYHMTGKYHGEPATVWSLGILLFVILCGDFPDRRDLRMINGNSWTKDGLSEECSDFIRCCLQIDPKQRIELEKLSLHEWFMIADQKK